MVACVWFVRPPPGGRGVHLAWLASTFASNSEATDVSLAWGGFWRFGVPLVNYELDDADGFLWFLSSSSSSPGMQTRFSISTAG